MFEQESMPVNSDSVKMTLECCHDNKDDMLLLLWDLIDLKSRQLIFTRIKFAYLSLCLLSRWVLCCISLLYFVDILENWPFIEENTSANVKLFPRLGETI